MHFKHLHAHYRALSLLLHIPRRYLAEATRDCRNAQVHCKSALTVCINISVETAVHRHQANPKTRVPTRPHGVTQMTTCRRAGMQ